jgi:hypothetical protein
VSRSRNNHSLDLRSDGSSGESPERISTLVVDGRLVDPRTQEVTQVD